jgi:hypothetical protein
MPDVTVRNETPNNLNIAFRFVAPANWTNTLTPGNSWTANLASTPYTIEVRLDHGNNRFSPQNSWAIAGDITGGWFAGAASVTLGALALSGVLGIIPRAPAAMVAGTVPLMKHAIEGLFVSRIVYKLMTDFCRKLEEGFTRMPMEW